METQKYTPEQVIDGGLELLDFLMSFCNKTGESDMKLKEELQSMGDEAQLHQKQQSALNTLSEIGTAMNADASKMLEASQETSANLSNASEHFSDFSDKVMRIAQNGDSFSNKIIELNAQTEEITKLVESIHKISSQTNLLSFNASIEAAHAGEAGKGFRIIANEVKKLSDSTDKLSTQISEKIQLLNDNLTALINTNKSNTQELVELQFATQNSVELMNNIRRDSEKNETATQSMISHIQESQSSISETIESVQAVEQLNSRKIKNIEESGKNSIIQINDRISFIIELEQIFKYLKETLAGQALEAELSEETEA